MKEKWNFILYLLWFSYLIMSAVVMFGNGFLLSRKTLSDASECVPLRNFDCEGQEHVVPVENQPCSDNEKIRRILGKPGASSVCSPNRHRVLLILVDALRYDFTEYDPEIEKPLHYQNRMPIIFETLQSWPDRTRLFRFMADPPTTTFQRVKALVTGSLPTFVDASSNFAAMELQEDNIIDQVTKNNGRVVVLGDDTWTRLVPGKWLRQHVQYSFHTWDLDTVDKEVDSKIYDEVKKDDWDLLVAHYLGVDHAGHRYGPNHPEMARKLNETNDRLRKILQIVPSDILLYVLGDHGMTETGDHGGESKAERTAAFFAYRGDGLGGEASDTVTGREVQQTDLAPTLSAALGRPPPAPSLGSLLIPALPTMTINERLLHLSNNLKQMMHYLVRYGEESQQVSLDKLAALINGTRERLNRAATVNTEQDFSNYVKDVRALIDNIRGVFREVWVEFDSLSMLRALLLLFLSIFLNWLITEGLPPERLPLIFSSTFVPFGCITVALCVALCYTGFYLEMFEDLQHAIFLSTGLLSGAIIGMLVLMHWDGISQRWYEGRSKFYERFARSALVASAAVLLSNSYIIEEGASLAFLTLTVLAFMALNVGTVKALAVWVCFGVVLALSREYRGCREEQGDCWTAGLGAPTGQASRAALILALGSTSAVAAVSRRHIGWRGHGIVLVGLFACAHWALGWGSLGAPSRSRLLARGSWLVLVTMFALLWRKEGRGATVPLAVCGLLIYFANALVAGAAYAPAVALALLSGFLALNIVSMLKGNASSKYPLAARCNSSVACLWALLASYQFYGLGHHATLGHVRWGPAFHAGDPGHFSETLKLPVDVGPFISVTMVLLDEFGMPLMFGSVVPLLALWGPSGAGAGAGAAVSPRTQLAAVFSLCLKFALCFAIRVFATAISATVHCRHLMIWGVFAPKYVFEMFSCAAALVGTLIGATLTVWHLPTQHRSS